MHVYSLIFSVAWALLLQLSPAFSQINFYVDADTVEEGEVILGVAKPGYTPYTYPHPLRSEGSGESDIMAGFYYVDKNHPGANDLNDGRKDTPWLTIQKANSTLVAGDTVYILSGTYDEPIYPTNNGSAGQYISYIADPTANVIIRQVSILNKDYIRVSGFEITHQDKHFNHAITLYGSNHCQILHNYMHHFQGQAIRNNEYYGLSNHNLIRGNTISYAGCPDTDDPNDCTGANAINLAGNFNVVEYNDISHSLDFINLLGEYNVIRNNYAHDFRNSDFPGGRGDAIHVDFWQPFSFNWVKTNWMLVENNYFKDVREVNSHFFQVRDESLLGMSEYIIRGNVAVRIGSGNQFSAVDDTRMYNNTFVDFHIDQPEDKTVTTFNYSSEGQDHTLRNQNFNNIYYIENDIWAQNNIMVVALGCEVDAGYNAAEGYDLDSSVIVSSNINFSGFSQDDFSLASNSHCVEAGKAITRTLFAGSGRTIEVVDPNFFTNGYGIIAGDSINVGDAGPVGILEISGNTIVVDQPLSWDSDVPVVLSHQNSVPSIGAYEYATDFSYDVELESPVFTQNEGLLLTALITNPQNVRFVEFFVDNIAVGQVYEPPYTVAWNGFEPGTHHQIDARAYARFASDNIIKKTSLAYSIPASYAEYEALYPAIGEPSEDSDNDSLPNLYEYFVGTDPTVPNAMDTLPRMESDAATVSFNFISPVAGRPDLLVEVQKSTDMTEWATIATRNGTGDWTGNGAFNILPYSEDSVQIKIESSIDNNTCCFYRLRLQEQ